MIAPLSTIHRAGRPEKKIVAFLGGKRATLESYGYFEVRGSHTGKRYRIRRGPNMNIDEVSKEGDLGPVWCFGPVGHLPLGDVMLAQKLALETDEQATLAVANRSRRRY
jgi:hypothetical protein